MTTYLLADHQAEQLKHSTDGLWKIALILACISSVVSSALVIWTEQSSERTTNKRITFIDTLRYTNPDISNITEPA